MSILAGGLIGIAAGTNPAGSTFKFNSPYIILTWCELQLAFQENGNLFTWSTFQGPYYFFYLSE